MKSHSPHTRGCFHSIGFPSEWGVVNRHVPRGGCIEFPFNWFPQRVGRGNPPNVQDQVGCFHSIGFPSEWGVTTMLLLSLAFLIAILFPFNWFPQRVGSCYRCWQPYRCLIPYVSIQLVSPASGELCSLTIKLKKPSLSFHSIGFPSEWGATRAQKSHPIQSVYEFPFNWFPQRVGSNPCADNNCPVPTSFHSIGFPNEWGEFSAKRLGCQWMGFPFNWFPQRVERTNSWRKDTRSVNLSSFHSIGFPSEWGV